ncbi:hypothetical protein FUAX_22830 [Fulvitalea axinellae]|uniref:Proteinase inhibitor I42 chagasin domain-containing protein n=1 Tax=Fulvitalea axinellae TaxID=1182444 RepID=A0AAU9DAA2_9BACT|nr:hypothetical protein FUAX_22830 [Fulvitalea axinellae]
MDQQTIDKPTIIKLTLLSLVIGGGLLVVAIMPAEYGIDPVGAGKLLGFDKLYSPETTEAVRKPTQKSHPAVKLGHVGSGPDVPVPAGVSDPAPERQYQERQDEVSVTIPAGKGIEYKVQMLKYGKMKYSWITDGPELFLDFHGEVKKKPGEKSGFYESYTVAYSKNMAGTLTAPFEGPHGWYFKNSGSEDVVVTIRMKGQYRLK